MGSRARERQVSPGTEEGDWLGLGSKEAARHPSSTHLHPSPRVSCLGETLLEEDPLWHPADLQESTHSPDHPSRAPTCLL